MRKSTTQTISILLCLNLAISLLFLQPVRAHQSTNKAVAQDGNFRPKIKLSYGFSDQINAGETFTFTININKEAEYQHAGEVAIKWIEGFAPQQSNINGATFSIDNNIAIISWDKLPNSHLVPFSFYVNTSKSLMGVYPVQVSFKDALKYTIKDNIGVYVANKKAPIDNNLLAPENKNPIQISLEYPDEILFTETYDLNINIAKGKNTGSAKIVVQLPPFSTMQTKLFDEYLTILGSTKFIIDIPVMPSSPDFTIQCNITNNSPKKSIYPIRASVEFSETPSVFFNDYIFITNQKIQKGYSGNSFQENTASVDTASMFSELDKLLNAWTTSTQGTHKEDKKKTELSSNPSQASNNNSLQLEQAKAENKTTPVAATKTEQPESNPPTAPIYTVQIAASKVPMDDLGKFLRSMRVQHPVNADYDGEYYRYSVGSFEDIEEAKELKQYLIKIGFSDAFGIKIENNERKQAF